MPKFCPSCGKPLPSPDAGICQACGAQVPPPGQPQTPPGGPPQGQPRVQPQVASKVVPPGQPQGQPPVQAKAPAQPGGQAPAAQPAKGQPAAPPRAAPAAPARGRQGDPVRNPILAVIFSFFVPGWGQWYNGQRWEGLKFFLAGFALNLARVASVLFLVSQPTLSTALSIILLLAFLGIWIYGMYHAYTTAQGINRYEVPFERKSRLFWLPVALIILMVVLFILIMLFAAAFVFGMMGGLMGQGGAIPGSPSQGSYERTRVVAATAKQVGDTIFVTWQGGRDNNLVSSYRVNIRSSTGGTDAMEGIPPTIGESNAFSGGTAGNDQVIVLASFTDGSQQVVLDTYV